MGAMALLPICDSSCTCEHYNSYRAHPWSSWRVETRGRLVLLAARREHLQQVRTASKSIMWDYRGTSLVRNRLRRVHPGPGYARGGPCSPGVFFFFFCITQSEVEGFKSLSVLNTSPPRNRCFMYSSCSLRENQVSRKTKPPKKCQTWSR